MNIQTLKSIRHLFNTNLCESLNAGVFHYAPKMTNRGRNFSALCHSATHSRKLGHGQSTISLSKAVGIKVPHSSQIYVQLKRLDRTSQFHKRQKSRSEYKEKGHFLRKKLSNRALSSYSIYSQDATPSASRLDHSYGKANDVMQKEAMSLYHLIQKYVILGDISGKNEHFNTVFAAIITGSCLYCRAYYGCMSIQISDNMTNRISRCHISFFCTLD